MTPSRGHDRGRERGRSGWGRVALLAALSLALARPAQAYIDPGTGSALVYVVTGVIVSAYFALRGLWYKLVELAFRVRFRAQKCRLAIHCEDPRYESTFLPILRGLSGRDVEATVFTMYERGDGFEPLPRGMTYVPIPPGLVGYSFLNHLEADLLVTTTPQLDVMTFRRSRKVRHYCHVPHALGESRYVRPFAYDFFDSVLCCGPLLRENIRRIESIRGLPAKRLLETGIPHYDELLARAAGEGGGCPGTVLVAPSWGPLSLFTRFGPGFVREIARQHPVVVRPHPQMRISQSSLYDEILAIEGVTVDTGSSPAGAMAAAEILVSDISGIVYEFAFIHEKPVVVVGEEAEVDGLEGFFLKDVVSLRERCADFIVTLRPDEVDRLPAVIDETLSRALPERIVEARNGLVHNFGTAGMAAARQIEEILRCP
jgi:hypothetical protein